MASTIPAIALALLATFQGYVGIREHPPGSNRGEMVDKFNRSAETDLGSPWCASVTHYGYVLNGLPGHGAWSPSWYSKAHVVPRDKVQPGDVGLIYFPSKGRYAHTIACIEKVTRSAGRVVQVTTLEGNTDGSGGREGDGFYRRVRAADTVTFVRWHSDVR